MFFRNPLAVAGLVFGSHWRPHRRGPARPAYPPSAWPAVSLWLAACIAFAGLDTARRHASRHGALGRCPPPIPPITGRASSRPAIFVSDVDQRFHRIEDRNDQTMIGMLVLCFFLGALSGGVWPAVGYGLVGALIGVPGGFVVNLSRRLFG